ncbi:DUF6907 domain-containing protein [Pseudactinotalea sp. Z1739]|uniref:DUF6907 domain-containing protein n=1 Tax=Pseudactinotalea sp. Z1739 TaxID=3413028 RepID=UPI003C798932
MSATVQHPDWCARSQCLIEGDDGTLHNGPVHQFSLEDGPVMEAYASVSREADGSLTVNNHGVYVYASLEDILTPYQARKIARALLDAAGQYDRAITSGGDRSRTMRLDVVPLGVLGVRVIEAPALPAASIFLPKQNLAVLDSELSAPERAEELEWLTEQVLAEVGAKPVSER